MIPVFYDSRIIKYKFYLKKNDKSLKILKLLKYAFPLDELDSIGCKGRGPDLLKPDNININDVLG